MSSDSYMAPVYPPRQEMLKLMTEELTGRLARFHNGRLDSIELHGLAEELDGLAAKYRAASERSVEEHVDPTVRKYRVFVESVSHYEVEIESTDADKMQVARDTDGGIFDEIGEGSWTIKSVERVE